ncbi:pyridoxine biosynthesis protein [Vermiconidia calcicola]|uniref:Pyridoxine biosynthesis protein n=1 Tax=Vermiconidia calcicola TaxID=1690605 RepID=A0ACC3MIH5_9PEZI|nr:pyridoxine biosynthesis protein [Vermiconidia calcicola]
MAGIPSTARLSARLASKHAPKYSSRRAFHLTPRTSAAQNYTMPALSPTMTEGNIAKWQMEEGSSFTAGDVILEIETDKATMDVEAQDDGILFKILAGDGAKGVKVGQRIAVLAETGDDLGSLEVPAEAEKEKGDEKGGRSVKAEGEGAKDVEAEGKNQGKELSHTASSEGKTDAHGSSEDEGGEMAVSDARSNETDEGAGDPNYSYPLAESPPTDPGRGRKYTPPHFPAVQQLLHENGLSEEDAKQIKASGPSGRLLKGDVLAHLGKINKDYPAQSSARMEKLSHLDLSNIQLMKASTPVKPGTPTNQPPPPPPSAAEQPNLPTETEIAVPISLSAVIATQKRVQDTLGIFLPLSTFVARASELANQHLPANKNKKPTANDLFNAVLGLDNVHPNASKHSSRGHYVPQISALSPPPPSQTSKALSGKPRKADIIDLLASKPAAKAPSSRAQISAALGISSGDNVFSVTAKVGEEKRATAFLERLKGSLEREPGRLVL